MYAEVKNENSILINRLDENERILLQTFAEKSNVPNAKLSIRDILDETGEFGGVFIDLLEGGLKKIVLDESTPKEVNVPIHEPTNIVIKTNVENNDITILTHVNGANVSAKSTSDVISVLPNEPQQIGTNTIECAIMAEGYEPLYLFIDVNVVPKEKANVEFKIMTSIDDVTTQVIEDAEIIIKDSNDTRITTLGDYYTLVPGNYKIEVNHPNYVSLIDTFDVEDSALLDESVLKIFYLEPKNLV